MGRQIIFCKTLRRWCFKSKLLDLSQNLGVKVILLKICLENRCDNLCGHNGKTLLPLASLLTAVFDGKRTIKKFPFEVWALQKLINRCFRCESRIAPVAGRRNSGAGFGARC